MENIIEDAKDETKKLVALADKAPLESKKFWSYIIGLPTIVIILVAHKLLKLDNALATHAMDTVLYLSGLYMSGQGIQDLIRTIRA